MIRTLVELLTAGGTAYDEVGKAGRRAVRKLGTGGDENTPAALAAVRGADAAFDELQAGADAAYDDFVRSARTTLLEAQARRDDGSE